MAVMCGCCENGLAEMFDEVRLFFFPFHSFVTSIGTLRERESLAGSLEL